MRKLDENFANDAVPAVAGPFRRALRSLSSSDPDGSHLRVASKTIFTLIVVALALFTGASVSGVAIITGS